MCAEAHIASTLEASGSAARRYSVCAMGGWMSIPAPIVERKWHGGLSYLVFGRAPLIWLAAESLSTSWPAARVALGSAICASPVFGDHWRPSAKILQRS